MSKKQTQITKITPQGIPAHLQKFQETDTSLEVMKEYRVLPRFKTIQGTAGQDLQAKFPQGTMILRPGDVLAAEVNDPLQIVTVNFFAEFCKWSDLRDKTSPSILERSWDPASEIARRARSAALRTQIYEGEENKQKPQKFRFVEHLNFVCIIAEPGHALYGEPVILDFSKGEFGTGKSFINTIALRKLPLWAQRWHIHTSFRDEGDKKWWGIDYAVPIGEEGWISEADTEFFQNAHREFQDMINKRRLLVDRSDKEDAEDTVPTDGKF
jgi:hypothetical protein